MKHVILTSALFLSLAGTAAFAQTTAAPQVQPQQQQHHAGNPHKQAMKMSKQLGLSQDQTAKLEPIFAERLQKMQSIKADTTLTEDQKKAQRHQVQQNTQAELSGVLTQDQMQQLKSIRKAHHQATAPAGV